MGKLIPVYHLVIHSSIIFYKSFQDADRTSYPLDNKIQIKMWSIFIPNTTCCTIFRVRKSPVHHGYLLEGWGNAKLIFVSFNIFLRVGRGKVQIVCSSMVRKFDYFPFDQNSCSVILKNHIQHRIRLEGLIERVQNIQFSTNIKIKIIKLITVFSASRGLRFYFFILISAESCL